MAAAAGGGFRYFVDVGVVERADQDFREGSAGKWR